jgi:hypothetical protein
VEGRYVESPVERSGPIDRDPPTFAERRLSARFIAAFGFAGASRAARKASKSSGFSVIDSWACTTCSADASAWERTSFETLTRA